MLPVSYSSAQNRQERARFPPVPPKGKDIHRTPKGESPLVPRSQIRLNCYWLPTWDATGK